MATLSPEEKKLLDDKNFAFVATLNKDGSPQVTPTWVDTDGSHVLINVATTRHKLKNVTRDPRVAIAIVDQGNPYTSMTLSGKVVSIVKGKEAEDHIDKMAKKYLGQDKYPYRQAGEDRILLKVEPSSVKLRK